MDYFIARSVVSPVVLHLSSLIDTERMLHAIAHLDGYDLVTRVFGRLCNIRERIASRTGTPMS